MADREIRIIVTSNTSQAVAGLNQVATATNSMSGTIDRAATGSVAKFKGAFVGIPALVGAAAGGAILKFGADSVRAATDLEESMNAVNVVFGEAADIITEFGERSAEATGLAQSEFQQMATTLGSSLINAGIPLDEAAAKTIELTQRAADMASVFNTSVPDALQAMQSALRGESDPIEKYGVTLSAAAVDAEAAALGFKRVAGQFDAQAKAAARLSLIMKQTSRVQGDFANTSDGLANKTRQLEASMTDLQAQIGAGLIPVLAELADEALDGVDALGGFLGLVDKGIDALTGTAGAASSARDELDRYSSVFDYLLPGVTTGFRQLADLNTVLDENAVESAEAAAAAKFMADATRDDLNPATFASIGLISRQGTAFSNAAEAADRQRTAMQNLANFQVSLITPVGNVLRLIEELEVAQENLATAQEDGETPARDLALAALAVEEAFLNLQVAGSQLTPDQIQAFAEVLIAQLGYSEEQALDTLDALGLLDGWTGSATFTLNFALKNLESAIAATGGLTGINNNDIQLRAAGGSYSPGPLVVGEKGPELLWPSSGGNVMSNADLMKALSGGGGMQIIVQSPMKDFRSDLQYAAILASVTNLVEAG